MVFATYLWVATHPVPKKLNESAPTVRIVVFIVISFCPFQRRCCVTASRRLFFDRLSPKRKSVKSSAPNCEGFADFLSKVGDSVKHGCLDARRIPPGSHIAAYRERSEKQRVRNTPQDAVWCNLCG